MMETVMKYIKWERKSHRYTTHPNALVSIQVKFHIFLKSALDQGEFVRYDR
jgi:hypothetical protein